MTTLTTNAIFEWQRFVILAMFSSFMLFSPFIPVYSSNLTPGVRHWLPWPCLNIYSNILRGIYSFVWIFVDFFQSKYICIFICNLFILSNIFRYSFVNIYHSVYIWIFSLAQFFVNGYYGSKRVQYVSKKIRNMKIVKIVQNNFVQIIWYSDIFE